MYNTGTGIETKRGRQASGPANLGEGVSMDTSEAATPHAVKTYLPRPPENRSGTALCLSGGGFRAALFHLGALRRLNELGILSRIDTITSVSGGSIIAAHLAGYLVSSPLVDGRILDW